MPAITARDSTAAKDPNVALILGLLFLALVLIGGLALLGVRILKRRRAARTEPIPSTIDDFIGKPPREKSYIGHSRSLSDSSTGPLLAEAPFWVPPVGRQPRAPRADLPLLPANAGTSDDEDHELRAIQTGPITYPRAFPRPGLRVGIPQSAPVPGPATTYRRLYHPELPGRTASPPPASPASDSDSMYSALSAPPSGTHTIDLTPPPPVPPLPEYLRMQTLTAPPPPPVPELPEDIRLRSELPPEAPPLARGATRVVAGLLKKRAKRAAKTPERSMTRTSRIERAGSIMEAPSPADADAPPVPPLPSRRRGPTDSALFDDYYTHPTDDEDEDESEYEGDDALDDDTLDYYTHGESPGTARATRTAF
ncbi:hypothetical protein FB451DRAFT_1361628 [Mycena latifolia]|nr:hypothetical protein FB451DRAFT_1361628 [Mycena latifolia]